MSEESIDTLKGRLRGLAQRVPRKVSTMGIEATRAFKKAVENANKQLTSARASGPSLREAISKLGPYQD